MILTQLIIISSQTTVHEMWLQAFKAAFLITVWEQRQIVVEALISQVLLLWNQRYISQPQRHRQLFLRYMWALIDISERRYWRYRDMIRWKAKFLPQLLTSFRLDLRVLLNAISSCTPCLHTARALHLVDILYMYYNFLVFPWTSQSQNQSQENSGRPKISCIPLLSALVEFQKAQCFLAIAVEVAAQILAPAGSLGVSNLRQLSTKYEFIRTTAIHGFLPHFCVHAVPG